MRLNGTRTMKRVLLRYLTHTYTRSTVTASDTEDDWGDEDETPDVGVSSLPCLYSMEDRFVSDALGTRSVKTPTLYVAPDDPLKVGDVVTAIADASGTVLLAGPLLVETVNPNSEAGVSVLKRTTLRVTTGQVAT